MTQYDAVPVTTSNIDWGLVLSSRLSAVRLSEFARGKDGDRLAARRLTLDGSVHGAADPSALAITPDGAKVVIALAGAHQVLLNDRALGLPSAESADLLPLGHNQRLEVVEVGRSPVALALDPLGRFAVTADAMSDTLSVVKLADLSLVATVALGDGTPERTPAQRGDALFRDGRRAMDRWMSCASCHVAGHTNGLNFDTLGDGGYGAAKNTPSLLGVGPTAPFAWTGRVPHSARSRSASRSCRACTGLRPTRGVVADLTAYLQSLEPPPPRRRPRTIRRGARGRGLPRPGTAARATAPPHYTSPTLRDVGLDDGAPATNGSARQTLRGVGAARPPTSTTAAPRPWATPSTFTPPAVTTRLRRTTAPT